MSAEPTASAPHVPTRTPRDPASRTSFAQRTEEALLDPFLRVKLRDALDQALAARAARADELPQFEEMRRRAGDIRRHVIGRLAEHVEQFIETAESRGVRVFLAEGAASARQYVVDLARQHGAEHVVKSKSMVTEEIGLFDALAEAGIDVVESDLGEFLAKLAGDAPSHLTAPVVHLSRADIGHLLEEKLGVPFTDRPEEITAIVRDHLRAKFLGSRLGITGANFLVGETGSAVVIENEGNVRLTTSLPPVHVIVAGIERIVPRWADLELFLTLLAASAGGQRLTAYTSVFTGPRREHETGGPDELHIVLVDAGRSDILADPMLREALCCIRCGACLNTCPVYRRVGGHAYGYTYPGPIGQLLAAGLWDAPSGYELAHACTLCSACHGICPVGIDTPALLIQLRNTAIEAGKHAMLRCWPVRLWRWLMLHPAMYRFAARTIGRHGVARFPSLAAAAMPGWVAHRELPAIAPRSFGRLWRDTRGFTDE